MGKQHGESAHHKAGTSVLASKGRQQGPSRPPAVPVGGTRRGRCALGMVFCFLALVGANAIALWLSSDMKHQHIQRPMPQHVVMRLWKDSRSVQDVYRSGGGNLSNPSPAPVALVPTNARASAAAAAVQQPMRVPVDSSNPTDPKHSFFQVMEGGHSSKYTLCDTLEILIETRDGKNRPKKYGGDYFWIKLASTDLHSSQAADEFVDHQDGTYTARFRLHWTGTVQVSVLLVKSSEYVSLLRAVRQKAPERFAYAGKFTDGKRTEEVPCHMTRDMFLGELEPDRARGFCNFSHPRLGYPWFCLRPEQLPCSSFFAHVGSNTRGNEYLRVVLKDQPESVIHKVATIGQVGLTPIEVISPYSNKDKEVSTCTEEILPLCSPGLPPRPPNSVAGFYHKKSWQSMVCQVGDFSPTQALKCLQGCSLYFYGDSTLRQWFEYLTAHLGSTMREEALHANQKAGPRCSQDKVHGISLFYRHHGYPIRNSWTPVKDIRYAAEQIDELAGGARTVVLLSLWAHFTPTDLQFYRARWESIRASLRRLRARAPGTPVVIKSANTREQTGVDMSNWYTMELDQVMREMMSGEPDVAILDVWDMTLSHSSGYRIHPYNSIISQEVKVLLSYLCPVH